MRAGTDAMRALATNRRRRSWLMQRSRYPSARRTRRRDVERATALGHVPTQEDQFDQRDEAEADDAEQVGGEVGGPERTTLALARRAAADRAQAALTDRRQVAALAVVRGGQGEPDHVARRSEQHGKCRWQSQ